MQAGRRMPTGEINAAAGAAAYTRPFLSIYDLYILGFHCSYVWECPSGLMLDHYDKHVSSKHLDVGVGTGYFLDKCRFPTANPSIALLDMNPNTLAVTAQRLERYRPVLYVANVLEPLRIDGARFDSIAMNGLLHCLPGAMIDKAVVFEHVRPCLNDGGVVFGSTILGQGVPQNFLARTLIRFYNSMKVFCNLCDNREDLEGILKAHFKDWTLEVVGCVAFFSGRS